MSAPIFKKFYSKVEVGYALVNMNIKVAKKELEKVKNTSIACKV